MSEISSEGTSMGAFDSRSLEGWKQRIIVSTLLAGPPSPLSFGTDHSVILFPISDSIDFRGRRWRSWFDLEAQKAVGVGVTAASVAANFAIVTGCYCSARELARDAQASEPDDLMNSMVGGLASGGILGILQGGQLGAAKYAILFAAAGTAVDFYYNTAEALLSEFHQEPLQNQRWEV